MDGVIDVLDDSFVVSEVFVVGGEAGDHLLEAGSDDAELGRLEDAEEVSEDSSGENVRDVGSDSHEVGVSELFDALEHCFADWASS